MTAIRREGDDIAAPSSLRWLSDRQILGAWLATRARVRFTGCGAF
jgi:hypothetical protein